MVVKRRRRAEQGPPGIHATLELEIESMTKSGASFGARSAAAGQLGAVFFLALGLFIACGNDIPEEVNGSAGMSGRTSTPGKAGKGNGASQEEVAGSAGAAPEGTGGSADTGGASSQT